MIQSIVLERMPAGSIPIFDGPGQQTHYAISMHAGWTQRFNAPDRLFIPLEIDTTLEEFETQLRGWVEEAQRLVDGIDIFPQNGTLVFVLQVLAEIPDHTHLGHLLIGGMAYMPVSLPHAVDLQGADPADLILRMCREEDHPIVREVIARQDRLRDERMAAWRIENDEYRKSKDISENRALKLLQEHLSLSQRRELKRSRYFHVLAQNGQRFRIYQKSHQNIFRIVNGKEVMQYCIVAGDIPIFDLMLAQKLLLETNFDTFHSIANKWEIRINRKRRWNTFDGMVQQLDLPPPRIRVPRVDPAHMRELYLEEDARVFNLIELPLPQQPEQMRRGA